MRIILSLLAFMMFFLAPSSAMAAGATLSLSPTSGTFNRGCNFAVDINVNTGGNVTDGVDVILVYDQSKLNATAITEDPNGNTYEDFPGKSIDNTNGKITISGLAPIGSGFSGQGTIARIEFSVLGNASGSTQIVFDFDPNDPTKTTDSNVVQSGTVSDILSEVTNASYTLGTGTCTQQGATVSPRPSLVPGLGKGGVGTSSSTPSLPATGFSQPTMILAVVGGFLTIVGILGLALL